MTLWHCPSMGGLSPFRGPGGAPRANRLYRERAAGFLTLPSPAAAITDARSPSNPARIRTHATEPKKFQAQMLVVAKPSHRQLSGCSRRRSENVALRISPLCMVQLAVAEGNAAAPNGSGSAG